MSNLLNITCSSVSKLVSNAHNLDKTLIEMIQFNIYIHTKNNHRASPPLRKGYAHKCDMHGENIST